MDFVADNDCLIIFLSGRIDSQNVADVEKSVRDIINENGKHDLIFEADKLNYISSTGLRFLLKFSKTSKKKIVIENVSKSVYEIFDITGLTKIFDVRKKLRNISIEGFAQVGMGRSSKVYRLDDDTIIKVYNERVPLYKITRENRSRRLWLSIWLISAMLIRFSILLREHFMCCAGRKK